MPDVAHSTLVDADLRKFAYFQSSDPGAVGAGIAWVDTTSSPYVLKVRNAADDGWETVGSENLTQVEADALYAALTHASEHATGGGDELTPADIGAATDDHTHLAADVTDLEAYATIKCNLAASVAPTTGDDSADGYAVGSRWIDTTNDKEYVCLDATEGAAVWTETTASGGSGGHTIQDEGSGLTARTNLNFVGAGVTATDDSGNDATVVTIPAASLPYPVQAYPTEEVDLTDYSWVNQDSATAVKYGAGVFLRAPAGDAEGHCLVRSLPAAPYKITLFFHPATSAVNYCAAGLVLRDSATGKLVTFSPTYESSIRFYASKWNDATAPVANYTFPVVHAYPMLPTWLQFEDDGTNRIARYSMNGHTFIQLHTVGNTDHVTPNQYGFYVRSAVGGEASAVVWSLTEGAYPFDPS